MANLRRHFNFSAKSSVSQEREMPFSGSSTSKQSYQHFDKSSLMNDICNCLDLCSSYIQALNSLCGAGSSLARNLFHAVREIPAYQQVSLQFLCVWEEASKATAGASAAVKTETLMMLQEILNSLEMCKNEADAETAIVESFQVIGTCLCSFIELQAQFSLSTWKSLSKLSKHFSSDSVRHSLQRKSLERTPSKIVANTDLNTTIKKHFSQLFTKVGISKANEHIENIQNQFYTPPHQQAANLSVFSPFGNQNVSENAPENSVWSPPPTLWSSSNPARIEFQEIHPPEQESPNLPPTNSDLDEVINLLSCVPAQQSTPKLNSQNQNFHFNSNAEQMYHILPKISAPPVSRRPRCHRSWPKDVPISYDTWLWRNDNMNCSGLPANMDVFNSPSLKNCDINSQWENKDLQKWSNSMCETGSSSDDGSSVHGPDTDYFPGGQSGLLGKRVIPPFTSRKHSSSGESMPGGLENISESKEECLWGIHSKISTWPLKQSAFRNSDSECQDISECSEYSNHHYTSR